MKKNQVILIYGMPATGKYTMAKRLKEDNGVLLDNHYFHDMFAHSTEVPKDKLPQYWAAVGQLKKQYIEILRQFYPKSRKMRYIFTSVLLKGETLPDRLAEFARDIKADFIPIELIARPGILKHRCQTEYRRDRKKISNSDSMGKFLEEHKDDLPDYTHPNKLCIDVSALNEDETFTVIQKHLEKLNGEENEQQRNNIEKRKESYTPPYSRG